jgi:hypothetical protein
MAAGAGEAWAASVAKVAETGVLTGPSFGVGVEAATEGGRGTLRRACRRGVFGVVASF